MGTMGLALPWEARISHESRQGESRVDPSENLAATTPSASDARAEDAALAAGCLAGDLAAYERLYALHASRMKSLARNLLGNPTDAEDAVQETFLKVHRAISSFRGQSSFVTWTFRILINTCYDARRLRSRKRESASDESGESSLPELRGSSAHPTLRLVLERALITLTRQQREVFLLYEVEGFRHAEIASILNISETASKNTLFQAKKNLRAILEPPRSGALPVR
jgi:RNA polymerase sigma-70 factor, ECF subfamily